MMDVNTYHTKIKRCLVTVMSAPFVVIFFVFLSPVAPQGVVLPELLQLRFKVMFSLLRQLTNKATFTVSPYLLPQGHE